MTEWYTLSCHDDVFPREHIVITNASAHRIGTTQTRVAADAALASTREHASVAATAADFSYDVAYEFLRVAKQH
jgi:hypothetical protein